MLTRDSAGWAAKGAWFEILPSCECSESEAIYCGSKCQIKIGYNIFKDPITDDGTKKSLKGFQLVTLKDGEYVVEGEVSEEVAFSDANLLRVIYQDGVFYNQTTLQEIRDRINNDG